MVKIEYERVAILLYRQTLGELGEKEEQGERALGVT